jgi:hypothetical protein
MSQDRRRSPRLRTNLKTYWESGAERHEGVVLNLSVTGCFIVTPANVLAGTVIRVEVGQPNLLHMTLEGRAVHILKGRGVGVRFKDMTLTQQALLAKLLKNIIEQRLK